jgi:hypothetical protein
MDLPVELAKKLDFSHGRKFRKEVLQLFGSSVHHDEASPAGSFFLLVTFRRYTFRLSEESVAFALASCLGGASAGFHVQYLSDRHFRFLVANKNVVFHVYNIRRFIGDHFDAYFHLWRDGAADWEREKRLWEIEQELQWTMVMSKSVKRVAKSKKKVHFAPETFKSPKSKVHEQKFVSIGQFNVPIASQTHPVKSSLCFGSNPSVPLVFDHPGSSENFESACIDPTKQVSRDIHDQQLVSNSFEPGFSKSQSKCCKRCFVLGCPSWSCSHFPKSIWAWKPKASLTKSKPSLEWRPKFPFDSSNPNSLWKPTQQSTQLEHNKKSTDPPHSQLSSNSSTATTSPPPSTVQSPPPQTTACSTALGDASTVAMANFEVNPEPYIPPGFDLEHWARPAHGRFVLVGNPPRRHDEYVIATLWPAPPQNHHQLHEAIDLVIHYFEEVRHVRILSAYPSPLGLCLLKFRSVIAKEAMINLGPHILPEGREITLEHHDCGLNLRDCPFARTCWVLFLCFPLDF